MNLDSKVGNEYLKIKLLGISTSALIMMLSNGVYASNEVPTASLNNNNELNNGTEIVQEIDSDDDSLDIDDLLNKDTTGENDNDVSVTNNDNVVIDNNASTTSVNTGTNNEAQNSAPNESSSTNENSGSENISLNNNTTNNSNETQNGSNQSGFRRN